MCESVPAVALYFLEAIKVELTDKTFEFLMSKKQWNDFSFHFFL
jgi:hypothetical protein